MYCLSGVYSMHFVKTVALLKGSLLSFADGNMSKKDPGSKSAQDKRAIKKTNRQKGDEVRKIKM